MAKRRTLPARTPRDRSRDDDSLLLRSAESLGRVIGALQRQLDDATRRLSAAPPNGKAANGKAANGKAANGKAANAKTANAKTANSATKRSRMPSANRTSRKTTTVAAKKR